MDTAADQELRWDPFDPDLQDAPYDVWTRLREEAPVYRNEQYDFYALSRYTDVDAAHRQPLVFSSAYGTVLEYMTEEPMEAAPLLWTDPPYHDTLRALVSRAFTPRRVTDLEPAIRELCSDLLDAQVGSGGFDYVQDFAAVVPSTVISMLLGVDPDQREFVRKKIDEMFHVETGLGMDNDRSWKARQEIYDFIEGMLKSRERQPGDDIVSALIAAEILEGGERRRLTFQETREFVFMLITAGTETVGKLLGWSAVLFPEHPSQHAMLAASPALIPQAIEEVLRYEAPSSVQTRRTLSDVTVHNTRIPQGSRVVLLTGAANRDDRQFPNPQLFDIEREKKSHLALGVGIHFCLGAALARLEARVALEETYRRFPQWQIDPSRTQRVCTSTVRGHAHVGFVTSPK